MTDKNLPHAALRAGRGDANAARPLVDLVAQTVPCAQALLLSTLPRGSLDLVQPARVPESMRRVYSDGFHRHDRVAWQAIMRGKAVRASDVWPSDFESTSYFYSLLKPAGLKYAAAAPLRGPLFDGFPGVLCVFRSQTDADFTAADLAALERACHGADEVAARARQPKGRVVNDLWARRPGPRFIMLQQDGQLLYPATLSLDDRVRQQMAQRAKQSLEQLATGYRFADRMVLPDTWGDLWVMRAVVYEDYPALTQGPAVVYTIQPEAYEWAAVRQADLQADPEVVRLLPALRFMYQEYSKMPTLAEIARKAHLSPFHFHRRFTDLIGQTPKHFLLSCQVYEAKRLLTQRKRELVDIAKDCGFAHQSHFTSRFKQATGLTPTRWRRLSAQFVQGAKGR
jgi:AraC-like DNA-binding protein